MILTNHSRTQTHATSSGDEPSINRETAGTVASLLRLVRPAWDQLVTLNAIRDASRDHRDLADLVAGSIRIAQDQAALTPKALLHADFADHWRRTTTPRTSAPRVNESCTVPGHEGYSATNCAGCRIDARLATSAATRHDRSHPRARFQEDQ